MPPHDDSPVYGSSRVQGREQGFVRAIAMPLWGTGIAALGCERPHMAVRMGATAKPKQHRKGRERTGSKKEEKEMDLLWYDPAPELSVSDSTTS